MDIIFLRIIMEVNEMQYESLSKLFYKNPEQYQNIWETRYRHEDTIHLPLDICGNPVFIFPNTEMWQLIVKIHKLNTQVSRMSGELPEIALQQFARRCLVDEIVLTNGIEGVNSTRKEVHEVLEEIDDTNIKVKRRFFGLVFKYVKLQSADIVPLDNCQDIRNLYDEVVAPEVIEEDPADEPDGIFFRKQSVSVTNGAQKEIHRGLMPEDKIISTVEQSLNFLHDSSLELLIRISAFHYLLGYIHPFYNGNGRLSRFISSYLLSKELNPLIGYRLSYTIKENLKKYYDSFKVCNDNRNKGDITPFVIAFLEIITEAMEQLEHALKKRSTDLRYYSQIMKINAVLSGEKYTELAFLLLQAVLFSEDGISTKELMQNMHISHATLKKRLDYINEHEYLLSQTIGKEKFYKLNLDTLERHKDEI